MAPVSARRGIGVLGATGYAGAELVRLLGDHPRARLVALASRQAAGTPVATAFAHLQPPPLGDGARFDGAEVEAQALRRRGVEVLFSCLPHGAFAERAGAFVGAGMRVIDLSADFRLATPALFERFYGMAHPDPGLCGRATYGLCEWVDAADAALVANPGCYATAILLGCLPAASAGWLGPAPIVINALSGVSGAGRSPKLGLMLGECGGSAAPYRVGQAHAHLGEVGQLLRACGVSTLPVFSPHLVPMARGIVASMALPLRAPRAPEEAAALYAERYRDRPFVRLLPPPQLPETRWVRGSNRVDIATRVVADGTVLLVFAALDNLVKGAAGQAIQNWNRAEGWDEATGLPRGGLACA